MSKRKDFKTLAKINNLPLEEAELIYLEPGNRLGPNNRYEVIHLIGTGSIGAVYLVKDYEQNECLFALKMILPHILGEEKNLDIFIDNISNFQEIKHPNIIQVYDFWKQNTLYFYTMEYVEGISLGEHIEEYKRRKENIPSIDACKYALQICQAIAFLLKRSIGHYLLHPENVLLKKETSKGYTTKLCDFGLYGLQPSNFWQSACSSLETSQYRAPEQKEPNGKPNHLSDIYTIGVLFYEILSHKYPQDGDILSKIRHDIPLQVTQLISGCLQKNAADRPKDVMVLVETLSKILENPELWKVDDSNKVDEECKPLIVMEKDEAVGLTPRSMRRKTEEIAVSVSGTAEITPLPPSVVSSQPSAELPNAATKPEKVGLDKGGELKPPFVTTAAVKPERKVGKLRPPQELAGAKDLAEEENYEKYLVQGEKSVQEKRYPDAIKFLQKSMALEPTQIAADLLAQAQSCIDRAGKTREKALAVQNDPEQKLKLLQESAQIYPYDLEVQKFILQTKNEVLDFQSPEKQIDKILSEGDSLTEQQKYEEAILKWEKGLSLNSPYKNKELKDRILQVVDIVGEQIRPTVTTNPYNARKVLSQFISHTNEPFMLELQKEAGREIEQRETRLRQGMEEAEKHISKKQYATAIAVWQSMLGMTPDDEILMKKIEDYKKIQQLMERDERDYMQLITTAHALEKKEDFRGALQALERVRQKEDWACPIADMSKDIERMTKMAAAQSYGEEMLTILTDATKSFEKKNLARTQELLDNPIFRRKMLPSIEKRYENLCSDLKNRLQRKRKMALTIKIVAVLLVIVIGAVLGFVYFASSK